MQNPTIDEVNCVAMNDVDCTIAKRAHYSPPWADVSIIGIAGSSGSGKSTLSQAIVRKLNLPWVFILSIVSGDWL
jgi:uridine kinase